MNIEVDIRGRSWFIQHSPVEKGDEYSSIIEKITKTPAHYNNSFNLQREKINHKTPLSLTFLAQLSQNRAVWQSLPLAKLWSWWGKFPNWSCKSDIWIHGLCRPRCRWGCPRSRAWPTPCRGHTTAGHSHLASNLLHIPLLKEFQSEMDHQWTLNYFYWRECEVNALFPFALILITFTPLLPEISHNILRLRKCDAFSVAAIASSPFTPLRSNHCTSNYLFEVWHSLKIVLFT